jgi:hypothetical protein
MPEILSPTQRRLEAVQDVIYFGSEEGPVSIKQAVGLTHEWTTLQFGDSSSQRGTLRYGP